MRSVTSLALASAFLLATAGALAAQTAGGTPAALTPGKRALSLSIPDGGGTSFGLWRVVTPEQSRGVFLAVTAQTTRTLSDYTPDVEVRETRTLLSASIGPRFRRYVTRSSAIASFLESGVGLGASYVSSEYGLESSAVTGFPIPPTTHEWNGLANADLGLGAEWFPLPSMSIAGRTGLDFQARVGRHVSGSGPTATWSAILGTFTSSIALQLYF